jgi:long-subunit fatty acid transport protein
VLGGKCALAAAVVAAVAQAAPARASTLDLFGYGGRSPGLAGTGVATADDYDAVYLNPAGLSAATRKRVTVGMLFGRFDLVLAGNRQDTPDARGVVFGGVVPMPLGGSLAHRVGLGIGFYVPLDTINKARAPYPDQPNFALLGNRANVIAIQVGLGVKLSSRLSVGAGVIALAALRGTIAVTTDETGRFTTFSEEKLITQFAPVVGARWQVPTRHLALGVTFRAPSRSDYDIAVTSDLGDSIPLTLPPIRIAGNAQYDPLTVAAEVGWRPAPDLLASFQLAYQRWSAFPLPTKNPVESTPMQGPTNFHDTAVPRASLEYLHPIGHARLAARVGYAFLWSPAGDQSGRQSLLDNNRHLVSLGAGLAWPDGKVPIRIDAWVQGQYLQYRKTTKDPTLLLPGESLPFSSASTRGHILIGGVTVGVDL